MLYHVDKYIKVGVLLCFGEIKKIFTLHQTLLLWTLNMLRMRAVVMVALNVYSANHNDPPT